MLLILLFLSILSFIPAHSHQTIPSRIPQWIVDATQKEFREISPHRYTREQILNYYDNSQNDEQLVKFTLHNNKLWTSTHITENNCLTTRVQAFQRAIKKLTRMTHLPDMVFLISMHDAIDSTNCPIPLFAMCKSRQSSNIILVPDFEALDGKFQVLQAQDFMQYAPAYASKRAQLIWRGSTAQYGPPIQENNLHLFSRVRLCQLSQELPQLIDAKFTIFVQGGENVASLQQFKGSYLSFEEQLEYKYQILIDGNASAYTASGWKFFSNSVIFKPDSNWIQWYHETLTPYIHYVPVQKNLDDLVGKILWAQEHEREAETIAYNARQFALFRLSQTSVLTYLYAALIEYSKRFVP